MKASFSHFTVREVGRRRTDMAGFQRGRDIFYAFFFVCHLITSLGFDAQVLFDRRIFPDLVRNTLDSYIAAYKDPIVGIGPGWLRAILYFEIIFQVPFLVFGFFGALSGAPWMRTPSIVYGTSLLTMMIPMLGYVLLDDFRLAKTGPVTLDERLRLAGIYGYFFLGGVMILVDNLFFRPPSTESFMRRKITKQSPGNKKRL